MTHCISLRGIASGLEVYINQNHGTWTARACIQGQWTSLFGYGESPLAALANLLPIVVKEWEKEDGPSPD